MDDRLARLLDEGAGAMHRRDALGRVRRHTVDGAVRRGALWRVHAGVYVDAGRRGDDRVLLAAALAYAGSEAALSHLTGLRLWQALDADDGPVHVTVPPRIRLHGDRRLVVHRVRDLETPDGLVVTRDGLAVLRLERCLVDAWPLLPDGPARRAPVLDAVAERRTTPERVRDQLRRVPKLEDRASLRQLLDRLEAGCRSELELWGQDRVFGGPQFRDAVRQHRVRLGDRSVYLDLAFPDVLVAVELDGAAWHGSSEQRERDLRRDSALAALGWVVLRFSARRLHAEPEEVRAEVLRVVARRRASRGAA